MVWNQEKIKFSRLNVGENDAEFEQIRELKKRHIFLHFVCSLHILILFSLFVYFCYQYYHCESTLSKALATEETPEPTDTPTLYIWVTSGCSMSSHLFGFSKYLLKSYGVKIVHWEGTWEFNHKKTNPLFHEDQKNPSMAFFEMWNVAVAQGKSMIIKFDGGVKGREWKQPSVKYLLHNIIPIKVAFAYRGNFLDRLVCMVRDCFTKEFGLSVDASTGLPNDLCFGRRLSKNKTQARLFPTKLMEGLQFAEAEVDRIDALVNKNLNIDRNNSNNTRVTTESLWEFESRSNWTNSIEAWGSVLHAWGFEVENGKIEWIMKKWIRREMMNSKDPNENTTMHLAIDDYEKMKQRKSHNNSIYNLDELLHIFGKDDRFMQYLHV